VAGFSVGCGVNISQSIVSPLILAGVPVLSRPNSKLCFANVCANPTDGGSTNSESRRCRPPLYRSCPSINTPRRNVPVVMTVVPHKISSLVGFFSLLSSSPSSTVRSTTIPRTRGFGPPLLDVSNLPSALGTNTVGSSNNRSCTLASKTWRFAAYTSALLLLLLMLFPSSMELSPFPSLSPCCCCRRLGINVVCI